MNVLKWVPAISPPLACPRVSTSLYTLYCKILKVAVGQTKFLNKINLFFEDTVHVERIIPAYGITSLLVELGSCLGLWLGLLVVGIFDVIHTFCLRFINKNF